MAFSSTTGWGVDEAAGSDTNGGGWDPASSGTNYANQSSPQVTYTDLVIDGSTNTKVTSAGNPFTSLHVGNVINITSGTGFTVQRVQVVSVSGSTATCDKAVGTVSSTGGHGVLGGSLASITAAQTLSVTGNSINIKQGTYTLTTGLTIPVSDLYYIGYGSTWSDGGTRPLITTATNSINIFTDITSGAVSPVLINLSLSTTAATPGNGIEATSRVITYLTVVNCKFSGFNIAIYGDDSVPFYINNCTVFNTEFTGIKTTVFACCVRAYGCYLHASSGADGQAFSHGVQTGQESTFVRCDFNGLNHGLNINNAQGSCTSVYECTFYGCASDGILCSGSIHSSDLSLVNNIFYGNSGYGVNMSSATAELYPGINANNAYGSNTNGARNGIPVGTNDVTLTANPFNNAGSGDFSLNGTAGGGAACKGAGFQI